MSKADKQKNKSVSADLLDSCRTALYQIKKTFDLLADDEEFDSLELSEKIKMADNIIKIAGGVGKAIETLAILEAKVERDELESSKRRGGGKSSLFEDNG